MVNLTPRDITGNGTIGNTGDVGAIGGAIVKAGADAASIAVTDSNGVLIAAAQAAANTVGTFTPVAAVRYSGQLTVTVTGTSPKISLLFA